MLNRCAVRMFEATDEKNEKLNSTSTRIENNKNCRKGMSADNKKGFWISIHNHIRKCKFIRIDAAFERNTREIVKQKRDLFIFSSDRCVSVFVYVA